MKKKLKIELHLTRDLKDKMVVYIPHKTMTGQIPGIFEWEDFLEMRDGRIIRAEVKK